MSNEPTPPDLKIARETERGDPSKPFKVRGRLGRAPTLPAGTEMPAAQSFPGAIDLKKVVMSSATLQLQRDTAIALIVGHVRMLAQILAIEPGSLGDIMFDAMHVFDLEDRARLDAAIAGNAPPG